VTRFERECLARKLAEVIDELYQIPRPRARRIALVAKHIARAIFVGWRVGSAGAPIDAEEGV
jgi:hypothetical protein